jgi:hypothetical protein
MINSSSFQLIHVTAINFQSHHLYPNSIYDLETSIYEPFFKYLPIEKSPLRILFNYFWVPFVYMLGFHGALIYR